MIYCFCRFSLICRFSLTSLILLLVCINRLDIYHLSVVIEYSIAVIISACVNTLSIKSIHLVLRTTACIFSKATQSNFITFGDEDKREEIKHKTARL